MVQTAPGQTARVPRTGLCPALLLVIPGATRPVGRRPPGPAGRQSPASGETANLAAKQAAGARGAGPFTQRHRVARAGAMTFGGASAIRTSGHPSGQSSQTTHLRREGHDGGHYRRVGARPATLVQGNVR